MNIILGTEEIVKKYMQYDSFFCFYENGIKDVVRNAVLNAGKRKSYYVDDQYSEVYWLRSLAGRTTSDWEYAIDSSLDHDPSQVRAYQMGQEKIDRNVIELVVEQIEDEVERMIFALTQERNYRVTALDPRRYNEWLGDDLVVNITRIQEE
ncbi:MAG: hypothetical protein P4L77_11080 [Sulfuriferula sp.]|nr:hypothetical protein [Sulfuriferula sp.]